VSLATVDRVLNRREAVRPETEALVVEPALRLGHPAARRLRAGRSSIRISRAADATAPPGQHFLTLDLHIAESI